MAFKGYTCYEWDGYDLTLDFNETVNGSETLMFFLKH